MQPFATADQMRARSWLVTAAVLVLAASSAEAKKKKKKKGAGATVDSVPCVACRRMLGHMEASLADAFNRLDAQVLEQKKHSEFDKQSQEKQMKLARVEIVEKSVSTSCAATGIMRPELGTACDRILTDYTDEFESALINHENYKGRAGLAEHLCGGVAAICPGETDWQNKGIRVIPQQGSEDFRSEMVPRSDDQPGFTDSVFKLVGHNLAEALRVEGKDMLVYFRRAGSDFDKLYHTAFHEFGAMLMDSAVLDTVDLFEIDMELNDLAAGPPVGGEYIEQPCMALYPDERKFSPVYIQMHTDPDQGVRHAGAEWFFQWFTANGKKETRWAVEALLEERRQEKISSGELQEPEEPKKKKKKVKKVKKPKKKKSEFAVTIGGADKPVKKWGSNPGSAKRPKEYDRESVLTKELVCSTCYVVIDEIEYKLRKLKNVAPVVGRRLDSEGSGINKRLNPGRNEVNVAEALEKACELTEAYTVSGVGKGQRWVRYNAREAGESILIESATVEAESPKKLTTACSWFLEENEDELWDWLLNADPDGTIQDEFCMTQIDECDGAIWDETKKPSKLYMDKDDVPDVLGMGDNPMPGHGPGKSKKDIARKKREHDAAFGKQEPSIEVDGKPAKLVDGKPVAIEPDDSPPPPPPPSPPGPGRVEVEVETDDGWDDGDEF